MFSLLEVFGMEIKTNSYFWSRNGTEVKAFFSLSLRFVRVKSAIFKKEETVNNLRKQHEVRDWVFLSELG